MISVDGEERPSSLGERTGFFSSLDPQPSYTDMTFSGKDENTKR